MNTPESVAGSSRLVGWKEVATYLGKGVRTVQRWERELALPIHRVKTSGSGGSVYAERHEIDEWLERQSEEDIENLQPAETSQQSQGDTRLPTIPPADGDPFPTHTSVGDPRQGRAQIGRFDTIVAVGAAALTIIGLVGALTRGVPAPQESDDAIGVSAGLPHEQPMARGVEPNPTDNVAYVVFKDFIGVLNLTSGVMARSIGIPAGAEYTAIERGTTNDGRMLVLGTLRAPGVALFDMKSEKFVDWHALPGRQVTTARLDADGAVLYALDRRGHISIVDVRTRAIREIPIPGETFDGCLDRSGRFFFAASRDAGVMSVVDVLTALVAEQFVVADGAHDVVTTLDSSRAFVSNEFDGSVSCIDLETRREWGKPRAGRAPNSIAISPNGRTVYVSNRDSNSMTLLNATSCRVQETIPNVVPRLRAGVVATDHSGRAVLVGGYGEPIMAVWDVTGPRARFVRTIELPGVPRSIHPAPRMSVAKLMDNEPR